MADFDARFHRMTPLDQWEVLLATAQRDGLGRDFSGPDALLERYEDTCGEGRDMRLVGSTRVDDESVWWYLQCYRESIARALRGDIRSDRELLEIVEV